MLKYILISSLTLLSLNACNSGGKESNLKPPANIVGNWIEKYDVESLNNKIQADGSCSETLMSEADDVGKYYLEINKIDSQGNYLNLNAVDADTIAQGNFIKQGHVNSKGKFTFDPFLLSAAANQGTVIKNYDIEVTAANEILTLKIKHQEVVSEGKTYIMNNENIEFIKITDVELNQYIVKAKLCAKNSKLATP